MPYISPFDERRLAAVDTKVRVRTTVATIFLAAAIVSAVLAVAAAVVAALQPAA